MKSIKFSDHDRLIVQVDFSPNSDQVKAIKEAIGKAIPEIADRVAVFEKNYDLTVIRFD